MMVRATETDDLSANGFPATSLLTHRHHFDIYASLLVGKGLTSNATAPYTGPITSPHVLFRIPSDARLVLAR